eukprot:CAMPEP_0203818002 /NCGR_PEP_ID=MMETSP0115-20131106/29622_1 /ASSEMBLY_ACC=CAM_ASM_000227 /TAXON_ID=33651 /ORGANISM="Bicosoecid sp, Strain ms1" /LENGTH=79 /DNA_ID=CAMNT_0050726953 /DNA_START=18 /DNA_END=254 /DNA_ORIENTATION=+
MWVAIPTQNAVHKADLLPDGSIRFEGKVYQAPSKFSLAVKQIYNPTRQADAGLRSIRYKREQGATLYDIVDGLHFDGAD